MKIIFFALLILVVEVSFAKTYYVSTTGNDSHPGTLERPFKTIFRGSKALAAGDTLYIRAGTYNESMRHNIDTYNGSIFRFVNGISKTVRTRYMAYPSETRKVVIKPLTKKDTVVYIPASVAYIEISGLVIDGTNVERAVRFSRNSEYKYPYGNRVSNNLIRFSSATTVNVSGQNEIVNNTIYGAGAYGVYASGPAGLVDGNTIYNSAGYGIHVFDFVPIKDWVIRNNTLYRNGKLYKGSPKPAVILSKGKHKFYNNIIYDNYDGGIQLWGGAHESLVDNNTIYGNQTYGIDINSGIQKAYIRNNIVWGNKSKNIVNSGAYTILQNNLTIDPRVVNLSARDFRLRSDSPARNKGITLSGVPFDFTKYLRPVGAYDIGAYEYR